MTPTSREDAKGFLLDYISRHGLRRTTQREAIVDAAMSTTDHFTVEDLLLMSRRLEPSVSRATVYRTLPILVQSGLLRELDLGGGMKSYDPNFIEHPAHNHLICVDCQKVVEFECPNIELLANCITRRLGFTPTKKTLTIEASCDRLKLNGVCDRKETHVPCAAAS